MKRMISIALILVMLLLCMSGCGKQTEAEAVPETIQAFAKAKIGVVVGSIQAELIAELLPEAQIVDFLTMPDAIMALTAGKVDAVGTENAVCMAMRRAGQPLQRVAEPLGESQYGFLFGKDADPQLKADFDEFLTKCRDNGTLAEMEKAWFVDDSGEVADYSDLAGGDNPIRFAVEAGQQPFSYIKNGVLSGYDVDMLTRFAREYGYGLEVCDVSFSGLLTGIEGGKYDMAGSGVTITQERKQTMDFSATYHSEDIVLVVRDPNAGKTRTLDDFRNAVLGVIDGSLYDGFSRELFPNARIDSYTSFTDLFQCVKQGKIDGFLMDLPNFNAVRRTDPNLSYLNVPGYSVDIGIAFGKNETGEKLQTQMNTFISTIRADGTYEKMWEYWCEDTEPTEPPVLPDLSGNEPLDVVFDLSRKPFVYLLNNEYAGFEVELIYRFCEAYGYNPRCQTGQWIAGIAGLKEGKYDVLSCGIYMTEERKESVNFCDPYAVADVIMVIYNDGAESAGFLDGLKESFEKTFIREDRWKLIAEGILNTVIISAASVLFGTVIGFGLYLLSRAKNETVSKLTKYFTKVYGRIIAGTPTLVVLMILYYVIFGKSDISGVVVAIVGFAVTFAAFVCGSLTLSVDSVDKGQTEAAYALGYTRNGAFFSVVLPQALKLFLPNFAAETVGLIKSTAVVGYITVNDLTKMGDIIRSNTYEAFFPLIAVAVIYFLITWGAAALLETVQTKTDFQKRKKEKILKGVVR